MDRFDCNETQITEGCRVRVIKDDSQYTCEAVQLAMMYNLAFTIASKAEHDRNWYANWMGRMSIKLSDEISYQTLTYKTKYLEVIPEAEYAKYDKAKEEALGIVEERRKRSKEILTLPAPTVNYSFRKFNFLDKDLMNTNYNLVQLGKWDRNDGRNVFHVDRKGNFIFENCCAFTKCKMDAKVFIPKVWLNYCEYLPYDLVAWCEFLSKCDIGFQYEYLGEHKPEETLHKMVVYEEKSIQKLIESGDVIGDCRLTFRPMRSYARPVKEDGYLGLILKGTDNDNETYLRFLCLRYIYNHYYWSIPGHAMQIKEALGEHVTHWEALLMAHLHHPYYFYYSLGQQVDLNPSKPYAKPDPEVKGYNPLGEEHNYNRHIYPFQKVDNFLERLRVGIGPNVATEYICDAYSREELNKFFNEQDYIGLYHYLRAKDTEKNDKWHLLLPLTEEQK